MDHAFCFAEARHGQAMISVTTPEPMVRPSRTAKRPGLHRDRLVAQVDLDQDVVAGMHHLAAGSGADRHVGRAEVELRAVVRKNGV